MELKCLNSAQTDLVNPLFHTFPDFMNLTGARQNADRLVSSIPFSAAVG